MFKKLAILCLAVVAMTACGGTKPVGVAGEFKGKHYVDQAGLKEIDTSNCSVDNPPTTYKENFSSLDLCGQKTGYYAVALPEAQMILFEVPEGQAENGSKKTSVRMIQTKAPFEQKIFSADSVIPAGPAGKDGVYYFATIDESDDDFVNNVMIVDARKGKFLDVLSGKTKDNRIFRIISSETPEKIEWRNETVTQNLTNRECRLLPINILPPEISQPDPKFRQDQRLELYRQNFETKVPCFDRERTDSTTGEIKPPNFYFDFEKRQPIEL